MKSHKQSIRKAQMHKPSAIPITISQVLFYVFNIIFHNSESKVLQNADEMFLTSL